MVRKTGLVLASVAILLAVLTLCERGAGRAEPAERVEAVKPAAALLVMEAAGFRLVPLNGIEARIEPGTAPDGKPLAKVAFSKKGEERRLLALEARPEGDPTTAKALAVRYRLTLTKGSPPHLALTAFEKDGTTWYRVGGLSLAVGEMTEGRLPLGSLRQAEFSKTGKGDERPIPGAPEPAVAWDKVVKTWVGIVIDGPAEGTLEISQARYTSEPYKPAKPLRVTGDGPGEWTVGHDKAAKAEVTTPNEGPGGKPCMKMEFTFPGGRHMYAIPSTSILGGEMEGYKALRFAYKATLPAGIKGLLVTVAERDGEQYAADPPPPASPEWKTVTLPLDQLKFAAWTKPVNGKLDMDLIDRVMVGAHGTASGKGGSGAIWAADIELVP